MARLRLLGTVLYYLAIVYGYYSLCLWVLPTIFDDSGGRAGFVFFGMILTPFVALLSELDPPELRKRLLDALLGDGYDR